MSNKRFLLILLRLMTIMKRKKLGKWALRIVATVLFIVGLLAGIVLRPSILYAHRTTAGNYIICHQQKLDPSFIAQLSKANDLLRSSALYDENLRLSVCLNDGSCYPSIVQKIGGPVFGRGFAREIVFGGRLNVAGNYVEINGYKWNLVELLAHEAVHCLEFKRYGLLHSNIIGHKHAEWKWEGYPEYVARKQKADLAKNIAHLLKTETTENNNWICFDDSTGTVIPYYKAWLLVQYCVDIRRLTFDQLLNDTTSEKVIYEKMLAWYKAHL